MEWTNSIYKGGEINPVKPIYFRLSIGAEATPLGLYTYIWLFCVGFQLNTQYWGLIQIPRNTIQIQTGSVKSGWHCLEENWTESGQFIINPSLAWMLRPFWVSIPYESTFWGDCSRRQRVAINCLKAWRKKNQHSSHIDKISEDWNHIKSIYGIFTQS